MDTRDLSGDLYDLAVLVQVHRNRSFSRSAQEIGVNQSAVSYTVEKLRRRFDDPLFTRIGQRLEVTERCSEIAARAERLIREYDEMLQRRRFDPAHVEATVTIAVNYYERQIVIPPFLRAAQARAPGLRIALVPSTSEGDNQLKSAQTDLLIGPLRPGTSGFYCRTVLSEHYVCVMCPTNPLASRTALDLKTYLGCRHATVTYGGGWRSRYLVELDAMGERLNEVLQTPSPAGLAELIRETPLVATVPARLAQSMKGVLSVVASPVPAAFDIDLIWTERTGHAGLHRWIRDELVRACRTIADAPI